MRSVECFDRRVGSSSIASPVAWGLLALLPAALLPAAPCEDPAPVEHVEVNLGTAVPVPILPNAGQFEGHVRWGAIGFAGHSLAFLDGGAVGLTIRSEDAKALPVAVGIDYVGALAGAGYQPIEAMASTTTILTAEDKTGAFSRLPNYGAVESREIYAGVKVRHAVNGRQLRTTYELDAAVDPGVMRLRFSGVTAFDTDPVTGVLSLGDSDGTTSLTLQARLNDSGRVTAIPLHADAGGIVSFELAASGGPLEIESVLTFGPYYHAPPAAPGPSGIVAIGRGSGSGTGADAVVLGLDAAGRELRWMTVLAGDGEDQLSAVAVSGAGRIYVTGTTSSGDFPLASSDGLPASNFLAELAADGTRLVGGSYLDAHGATAPHSLTVESDGSVLVAGRAANVGSSIGMDFTTLLPAVEAGEPSAPYFLARLDADVERVVGLATFEAADVGPPLDLALPCDEVVVGYCELPPEMLTCSHPFFVDPYSISVFGVFEDGFVDTVPEGWGYHALRWKAEFKAATYNPAVLPDIPAGLVEEGDQWDLVDAEANTALFPVNPGGEGPEWGRSNADSAVALAVGAAMNMDLFQTPAYTNLHIDGADMPAAIVEAHFCVDGAVGQSLRDLCDVTVEDLGLGWFQVDVVDSACALQFAGDFFVDQVWVSDWAGGSYTEGRLFDGITEFEDAYAVTDAGTNGEIYIVDPPVEAAGAGSFVEEFASRFESHVYEPLPVIRTVYVDGRAALVEPALAKVRVRDLVAAESEPKRGPQ